MSNQNQDNSSQVFQSIATLLKSEKPFEIILQQVCDELPKAYPLPHEVSVKIMVDSKEFCSSTYKVSQWIERHPFDVPGCKICLIEIYFSKALFEYLGTTVLFRSSEFMSVIVIMLSGYISSYQLKNLYYSNSERLKELKGIKRTADILEHGENLEKSLQQICNFLPEAWQYPENTAARIVYDDMVFTSPNFKETPWVIQQKFETPDFKTGSIEVFYLKEYPASDEGPFMIEERHLIDNLAALISGTASKKSLKQLLAQNTERLKELRGINQTSLILKQSKSIEESLAIICSVLPEAWQFPEHTAAKIIFENREFTSPNFRTSNWKQTQQFEVPGKGKGVIEIYYLKKFPKADEGPFLKEERNLLINLANLIAGSAVSNIFNKLQQENKERLKELWGINQTSKIIARGEPLESTLLQICEILPKSWQYPKHTAARIIFEQKIYESRKFKDTLWVQRENFITIDNKKGTVEIYYLKEFPRDYEGPFLKEERDLLINICKLISGYLNDLRGREIFIKGNTTASKKVEPTQYRESLVKNKDPLQLFFNKRTLEKYIYLDMMKFKVKEILFVATLYDAFTLQVENNFFEQFMGIIYQYSLFSLPRITGVNTSEEALQLLDSTHFDLAILMVGLDTETPIELSEQIKLKQPNLSVYLLLNQNRQIQSFEELVPSSRFIDKLFIWNGNSQIFFAMVKSLEDKVNVENDTQIGLVRVILLVEDSAYYYSKYLQILYSIVFGHVQQLLPEVEKNELDKIVKMRQRPKILVARNYEDAMHIFNKYKDFMLCVISDVEFEKEGKKDKQAGIKFIKYIKSHVFDLPIVLQSSDNKNIKIAKELKVKYINKNSHTLLNDLRKFLIQYIGFGDFIFRDKNGKAIGRAKSLREFEMHMQNISDESFYFHALENQFSLWLMARGEIQLARTLNPLKIGDFSNVKESKAFFIEQLKRYKEERKKGHILNFEETSTIDEFNIISFAGGSFGGKGRGLAFINALINNIDLSTLSNRINIRTPKTVIIGTDEFEYFIEHNKLYNVAISNESTFAQIKQKFVEASLSNELIEKLKVFLDQIEKPIAVRSSSLLEDSVSQPFAGIFDTYIIPNTTRDKAEALIDLVRAIKLVFASVYSDDARAYFNAINHKIEEEKMAIVLQELVGSQNDNYFYPHFSGVAQSYNFYPVSHMNPEEGFAVLGFGLGTYVVGGNNAFRFSPKYPKIEMFTTRDLLNTSQKKFYALDMTKKDIDYISDGELASLEYLDISIAEQHGTLKHCASTFDIINDSIEAGLGKKGPRVLNFANILKYNYIPLAETIETMLKTLKDTLGAPVEIEFAVDLNPTKNGLPSFYLLQVKPLVSHNQNTNFEVGDYNKEQMVLCTHASLGNGTLDDIRDVIFVVPETFDKMHTQEMVNEMEYLNSLMCKQNKQYILIGPGRWGTRDKFLGIPVNWHHISNAKVIVEISLSNFPLDSSLGSHFFHNVTSMNIGYFSVIDTSQEDFIKWDILNKQTVVNSTKYFKHIRFQKPLTVMMNGSKRIAVILDNAKNK
jgi:hypothetical protein